MGIKTKIIILYMIEKIKLLYNCVIVPFFYLALFFKNFKIKMWETINFL
jgi:hypothetical protein